MEKSWELFWAGYDTGGGEGGDGKGEGGQVGQGGEERRRETGRETVLANTFTGDSGGDLSWMEGLSWMEDWSVEFYYKIQE